MAQKEEAVHTIEGRGQSVKQEQGNSFHLQLHSPSDLSARPSSALPSKAEDLPSPNVTRVQCVILATVLQIQTIISAKLI